MATTRCKMAFSKGKIMPKLCICGGYEILHGGKNVGSFFLDEHKEFVCSSCGRVLNRYGEYK